MFKKIKKILSYEYATESRQNFIKNRLLAVFFDTLESCVLIVLAIIVSKLVSMLFFG